MASKIQSNDESIRSKTQQDLITLKALGQLLLRPNITVKKTCTKQETLKKVDLPVQVSKEETSLTKKVKLVNSNLMKKDDITRSLLIPQSKEYYPDKIKRKMPLKKIVLLPRHEYTVVGTTNKRKRKIPHKEVFPPSIPPELTMQELVLAAEQQGLDDEDLMEILTCPSPVWWEDAADQEEIYIRFHEDTNDEASTANDETTPSKMEKFDDRNKSNAKSILERCGGDVRNKGALKYDINFFTRFVEKRSKLENVLGFIKFKKSIHDKPLKTVKERKVRKDSGHSDNSINHEELLNDLENIEIPVAGSNKCNVKDNKRKRATNKNSKVKAKALKVSKKPIVAQTLRRTTRIRKAKVMYNVDEYYKIMKIDELTNLDDTNNDVPTDLPPLTKNPFPNIAKSFGSPKSVESTTSDTTIPSVIEFDSISDTNIKFLDEFEEDKSESNKKDTENQKNVSPNKPGGDLVTVYRILSNIREKVDLEELIRYNLLNKDKKEMNVSEENADDTIDIDKKRKNAYKNKMIGQTADLSASPVKDTGEVEAKSPTKRAIRSAVKKVSYCHKCNRVFVTEQCHYCVKKNVKKNAKPS